MSNISEKYPTFVVSLVSVAMLLIAVLPIRAYGYYILLRWVVCGTSAFIAFYAYDLGRKIWMSTLIVIALLFNPLIPLHLDKESWVLIDLIAALIIFISIWFMKKR